jgi:hypothetical protein
MLPVRELGEWLGADWSRDPRTGRISFRRAGASIGLAVGKTSATIGGSAQQLPAAPVVEGGVTYVPARLVAEALGAHVEWSDQVSTLWLRHPETGEERSFIDGLQCALGAVLDGDLAELGALLDADPSVLSSHTTPGTLAAEADTGWALLHAAAFVGQAGVAELLLARGASVDTRTTQTKDTPLHLAALQGHAPVVRVLLANGADVNARSGTGRATALHLAAGVGHAGISRLLLSAGANPDARDDLGLTPLHHAACFDHTTTAVSLLDAGADVNATDEDGRTPLAAALSDGNHAVAQVLRARGAHR